MNSLVQEHSQQLGGLKSEQMRAGGVAIGALTVAIHLDDTVRAAFEQPIQPFVAGDRFSGVAGHRVRDLSPLM
jgi:hypothetical protein